MTTRETCIKCGMLANVDPSEHRQRYRHSPEVSRDGVRHVFDWRRYIFVPARSYLAVAPRCVESRTDKDTPGTEAKGGAR